MHFLKIAAACAIALHPEGLAQDLASHERIPVAIASDPTADPHERGHIETRPLRIDVPQLIFEFGIKTRQLAKERVVVIAEAVRHLIENSQPSRAQNAGLPQRKDSPAQSLAILRQF